LDLSVTLLRWNTDINTVQFPINKCNTNECRVENLEIVPGMRFIMLIPETDVTPLPKAGDTGYIMPEIVRARRRDLTPNGEAMLADQFTAARGWLAWRGLLLLVVIALSALAGVAIASALMLQVL
jgi:hypothetical protein